MTQPQAKDETESPDSSVERSSALRWLSALNQPFAVTVVGGAIVFLISSLMQQYYWKEQQGYLFDQEAVKLNLTVIDETIRAVDRRASTEASVFTAYESNFSTDQKRQAISQRETAREDYEKDSDLRKLRIRLYFPDPEIEKAWKKVDSDIATLDCFMMHLTSSEVPKIYGCDELHLKGLEQNALIAKGRPFIDQTHDDLQKLAILMVSWAKKPH